MTTLVESDKLRTEGKTAEMRRDSDSKPKALVADLVLPLLAGRRTSPLRNARQSIWLSLYVQLSKLCTLPQLSFPDGSASSNYALSILLLNAVHILFHACEVIHAANKASEAMGEGMHAANKAGEGMGEACSSHVKSCKQVKACCTVEPATVMCPLPRDTSVTPQNAVYQSAHLAGKRALRGVRVEATGTQPANSLQLSIRDCLSVHDNHRGLAVSSTPL